MDEQVSKSERKRQAQALQKIGEELVDLSIEKLNTLPLTDHLYKAILDAKTITSHGAKRRQFQLIGKLMRAGDSEGILSAYQHILDEGSAITAEFHEVELWRDKLISGGNEALTEFITSYQPTDIQQLRHMIKKAQDDLKKNKNTGASKALFRFLRLSIE